MGRQHWRWVRFAAIASAVGECDIGRRTGVVEASLDDEAEAYLSFDSRPQPITISTTALGGVL
jgi:hypothetical protein